MIDQERLQKERIRVAEADRIQARLNCIASSLGQLEGFSEVRISSPNCCTWHPNIATEKVKQFVRDVYAKESETLSKQLSELYPSL